MIGRTVGSHYQIERQIDSEGPAQLYVAHREDSSDVLLWIVEDGGPVLTRMFVRTANRASQIENDRIPRILDAGEDSEVAFVAVERAEGAGLDHVVKGRGRMPVTDAVGLAYQGLMALQAIHDAGLAHGRIEPRRLILQEDGLLKLTGLETAGLGEAARTTTPYTAPEVKRGQIPNVSSDLFSLAVVLYELLSSRLPFSEDDGDGVATPLIYVRPDVPRELDKLLGRALDADPERRPRSAEEMRMALEAAIQDKPYEMAGHIEVMAPEPEVAPPEPDGSTETAALPPDKATSAAAIEAATPRPTRRPLVLAIAAVAIAIVSGFAWFGLNGGAAMLNAAPVAIPTAAPTALPPTVEATIVPPTAIPPTAVPTSAPTPTVPAVARLVKVTQQKDPVGLEWWVSEWTDGTTTRVEIVPAPALDLFNAKVRGLQLFESSADGLALEKREYSTRFAKESARFMNYELNLAYPDPGRSVNFTLRAFYYDATERLIAVQTQNAHVEAGWTQSYHWNGYGWADPGRWAAGKYHLDLFDGTRKLGSIPFEIY